jgi:hypothetical protein
MTPRPEVPREVWVLHSPDVGTFSVVEAESDARELAQECEADDASAKVTVTRYVTPAPALLTAAQGEALEAALAMPQTTKEAWDALREAVWDATGSAGDMSRQGLARWLLAAHARCGGGV